VLLLNVMGSTTTAERRHLAVTVPLILPSANVNGLGLRMLYLSRLNIPPRTITVYASRRSSPSAPQHSLLSRRYPLLRLVFHQLDHASFPGALTAYQINRPTARSVFRRSPSLGDIVRDAKDDEASDVAMVVHRANFPFLPFRVMSP
jgi:hypothetical protein